MLGLDDWCSEGEQAGKLLPGERNRNKGQGRGNTCQERETGAGSPWCRIRIWDHWSIIAPGSKEQKTVLTESLFGKMPAGSTARWFVLTGMVGLTEKQLSAAI